MQRSLAIIFSIALAAPVASMWNAKKVVHLEAIREGKGVLLNMAIEKGYGVQKKAPHKITLFRLKSGHFKAKTVKEKIAKYGKAVKTIKKLRGTTAAEDKKYYSSLKPIHVKGSNYKSGDYAVQARLYYCSFASKFCSVQVINKPIP